MMNDISLAQQSNSDP